MANRGGERVEEAALEPILAAAMRASLDAQIVIDEAGNVLEFNPAAEAMFGYARSEALGRPLAGLIVPDHLRARHEAGLARYVAGGEPVFVGRRAETEAKDRRGRVFPVEVTIAEVRADGRRVFAAGLRDMSDHKEELEDTQRQLELAVAGAQLGVWSYNPHTGISWYSDRVKEIVGFEDNFLPDGEAFRSRVHPEDRDQLVFDRDEDIPEGPVAADYRIVRPDGEVRWLHSLGAAERDEKGEVEAIHGVIIDVTERKHAEAELERTRQELELAVRSSQLGAWSYDPRTFSSWYSDRAAELLGLESNVLTDSAELRKHIHPDDWRRFAEPYYGRYPDEPLAIEYRVVLPGGGVRWVSALGAAVRDDVGELEKIHGILFDITERKRSEEELHSTRRQLELAVDGAKLGVWRFDPGDRSLWYSEQARALYGLPPGTEATTVALRAIVHPDDWRRLAKPYYEGYPEGPLEVEYRIRRDGEIRWLYALGTADRDADGNVLAVNGILMDITDRKRAETELAEARRHLELAVDAANLGIWTLDPRTAETWYSDRSRNLWGVDHELRLDAEAMWQHIHPEDRDRVLEPYRQDFPGDVVDFEHRVVWPNGDIRWVHSLGRAIRDENGIVVSLSGIHLDVTERKRAEEELARSREALHQSEKLAAMGSMLAGVSHELNNPLAAIIGQAEMMEEDARGTPLEGRAAKIKAAAERSARIVQTFLAMARQKEPQRALVQVNDLVAAALDLTEYGLRTAGVSVRVDFGSGLPPVEGDRDQLHQVLVNLIVNAQQAMEKGEQFEKTLTIRTSVAQSGQVLVDIRDTGPGVADAVAGRVFEPFFTTKAKGTGTGIGLSFSIGIVQAHKGALTLEPSRRGAHFRIALPPAVQSGIVAVRIDHQETAAAADGRRILIAEDEPDVAETLKELLEREGYVVTLARDGAAALGALDHDEFDFILSDLRMPGLSGVDLYHRLEETRPHLLGRMAFITGDTLGSAMHDFLRRSGRHVLEKPFTRTGVRCLLTALAGEVQ